MKEKVSIKRIAEISGVSTCTVSKVLNNTGSGYSEKTAQKVRAIADSLNYIPDSAAKMLKESVSYTVGLVVPNIRNDFFSSMALYIEKEMNTMGYSLFIANGNNDREKEEKYFRVFASKGVDAVISCTGLASFASLCSRNRIPLVCVGRYPKDLAVPVVAIDNVSAGQTATKHLIEKGCRHILFLGYATAEENRQAREEGYARALKDHNIKLDKNYIVYCREAVEHSSAAGEALSEFLSSGRKLDGIFAANDSIALGALTYLMRQGYQIPDDIKIIGFDNSTYSKLTYPGITTIDIHSEKLAYTCCHMIRNMIQGKTVENTVTYIPYDLVQREST